MYIYKNFQFSNKIGSPFNRTFFIVDFYDYQNNAIEGCWV